jgi:hypothetical protein
LRTRLMRSNGLIRRGLPTLALAAALVGGLATGAGTAAAVGSSGAGSFDIGAWEEEILVGSGSVDRDSDLINCRGSDSRAVEKQVGDVTVRKRISTQGYPGNSFSSQIGFQVADKAGKFVHRFTDYPPSAAYKLQSFRIQWLEEVDGTWYRRQDDHPMMDIDDQTGAVTITGAYPISTDFVFWYTVPWTAQVGSTQESGVGFTATGLDPQDWPVMEGTGFEVFRRPITCGATPPWGEECEGSVSGRAGSDGIRSPAADAPPRGL